MAQEQQIPQWAAKRLDKITKGWISNLKNLTKEEIKKSKEITGYENHHDFWFGYILGAVESHILQEFLREYGRAVDQDEYQSIKELVGVRHQEIKDAILKIKFNQ